ncbi:MAG: lytic transglycosylase domain-containing protein [Arenimonas sp.]
MNAFTPWLLFLGIGFAGLAAAQDALKPAAFQRSGADVFQRISSALDPASCTESAAKSTWMKEYIHIPNRFERQLIVMLPILDHVSYQARKRGLPMEYALIPFVESRFQPKAVAKGGPTGLWQIMPETGRYYGLQIGGKKDGRFSVIQSTDAALSYLQKLQIMFDDWQTGIMAYNAGDSRLRSSLRRQGLTKADADKRLPTGLAPHTYAYVKKIRALSCFMFDPASFGVNLPNDAVFTPLEADTDPIAPAPDNGN